MKVLICDDESDIRLLYRTAFEQHGADVVVTKNGDECVQVAAADQPDMVILDLMMPIRDGFSTLAELHCRWPSTIVYIVIAFAQRAIAVDNIGPATALREGWALLRAHPGASVLVCLLNFALSVGAGLAGGVALLAVLVPLGIIGAITWAVAGLSAVTIGYLVLAGLVLLAVVLVLVGIANTFFWNFWTLAYLRLSGSPTAAPAAA